MFSAALPRRVEKEIGLTKQLKQLEKEYGKVTLVFSARDQRHNQRGGPACFPPETWVRDFDKRLRRTQSISLPAWNLSREARFKCPT